MANLEQTINQAIADFDAIETAIEENGVDVPKGTDTSEYGNLINEAVSKKYNEGKQAEYDDFWDGFQQNGDRNNYFYAFYRYHWTDEIYKPKYTINMASTNGSKGVYSYSSITNTLVDISCLSRSLDDAFNVSNLVTIHNLIVNEQTTYTNNTFGSCTYLENLTITGTIGQNGFNVQWSRKLTHDSLMSIVNALEDKSADISGTEWKVTIGATNYAKLSTDEINIAINKGWFIE